MITGSKFQEMVSEAEEKDLKGGKRELKNYQNEQINEVIVKEMVFRFEECCNLAVDNN